MLSKLPWYIKIRNAVGTVINSATYEAQTDGTQKSQITNGTIEADVETDDDDINLSGKKGVVATAIMYGRTASGAIRRIGVDLITRALMVIDYVHHEIHAGSHYYIQGYVELNDTDTFTIKLVTPDTTKWSHFIFKINSTGITETTFDEDATGGMVGGSSIVPINNNRNSGNASGMVFTGGVTPCTGYTLRLDDDKWGSDGFKATVDGGSSRDDELILKQDTIYCRNFISGSNDSIVQFKASWYEHTSKT